MATNPDLQAISDAAYAKIGQINAAQDAREAAAKRQYETFLANSRDARPKSLANNRANASHRGLLDSTIALDSQSDTNKKYDQANLDAQNTLDSTTTDAARQRLNAQSDYNLAQNNITNWNAADAAAKLAMGGGTPAPVSSGGSSSGGGGDSSSSYTPGGYDDPNIDWNAIASIFGPKPTTGVASTGTTVGTAANSVAKSLLAPKPVYPSYSRSGVRAI